MKLHKILPAVVLSGLMGLMAACDTCDLSPVTPPVVAPGYGEVIHEPSMTLLEFKQKYWSADPNSCAKIGLDANGDSIYLRGRVISSDQAGNIYKSLVLQDESAALAFSINKSGMYTLYQYGQEIVVNVSDFYVGTYRSLFQVGGNGTTETSFGDADLFAESVVPDGWADVNAVVPMTVTIDDLKTIKSSTEGLQQWQSQLVRIDGLTFEAAGQQFAPTQNESRYLRDSDGNRINLRCSSYADFATDVIPSGTGSIVGILSYYGSTTANADWQVLLIDLNGLIGFDKAEGGNTPGGEAAGTGSKDDPYTVTAAMSKSGTAWVKGYIVGAMNTADSNNYIFESAAPFSVVANLYIAETPDETETSRMLPVQLVSGTAVRTALNLKDNPANLGKEVILQGSLEKYFGQPGIKSTAAAILDGTEIGTATGGDDNPGANATFVRATSIANGKYIIWSDNKIGLAFQDGYNYGYMQSSDCTPAADGSITASDANLFTFTQEAKGWTIADSHGQYLYQDTTHDSFQLTKTPDLASDYSYWTITPGADGAFTIVNCGTGKTMRYDPSYKTYAAYADASKGSAVYLYQSK
ncbi:MAG: hypothetical protein K2N10_01020 [Muribaculaceae bacterium]|nr:hypothetical protein [Muribaculaceae bacterium]